MKPTQSNSAWLLLLAAALVCPSCVPNPADNESGNTTNADSVSGSTTNSGAADNASSAVEETNTAGWMDFQDVLGPKSKVSLRLTPAELRAGEPVKVELKAGSDFGPYKGMVWIKTAAPDSIGRGPAAARAEGWQELKAMGTGGANDSMHEGTVTIAESGKTAIGLKFVPEFDKGKALVFELTTVEVK